MIEIIWETLEYLFSSLELTISFLFFFFAFIVYLVAKTIEFLNSKKNREFEQEILKYLSEDKEDA